MADRATHLEGSPHQSCKRDQIKMRYCKDRRVTPPKWVTSPTWGPSQLRSNFAMSTFQGEVTQASRGRIRADTSNSRKIHFGAGWLHIIVKGNNRKPQH